MDADVILPDYFVEVVARETFQRDRITTGSWDEQDDVTCDAYRETRALHPSGARHAKRHKAMTRPIFCAATAMRPNGIAGVRLTIEFAVTQNGFHSIDTAILGPYSLKPHMRTVAKLRRI